MKRLIVLGLGALKQVCTVRHFTWTEDLAKPENLAEAEAPGGLSLRQEAFHLRLGFHTDASCVLSPLPMSPARSVSRNLRLGCHHRDVSHGLAQSAAFDDFLAYNSPQNEASAR